MASKFSSPLANFGRRHKKGLALLLTFSLLINMLPTQSVAYAVDEALGAQAQEEVAAPAPEPEPAPASVPEPEPEPEPAPAPEPEPDSAPGQQVVAEEAPAPEEQPVGEATDGEEPVDGELTEDEVPEAELESEGVENPEDEAEKEPIPAGTLTAKVGKATVSVGYAEGAFDEPVTLSVREISQGSADYARVEGELDALAESRADFDYDQARAFDITFLTADGTPVEPKSPVNVAISLGERLSDNAVSTDLVHLPDEGRAEVVENANVAADGSTATFESDAFSVYVVTAKDAEGPFEVDGAGYDTLADAIDGISGSGTIWVTENATESGNVTIPAGKDIVLKVADGKALTINGKVTNNGTLELNDGINISTTSTETLVNNGTLTMKGGSVKQTYNSTGTFYAVVNNGTFAMSGGSMEYSCTGTTQQYRTYLFRNTNGATASFSGGSIACDNGPAVLNESGATITSISGGEFRGGSRTGGTTAYFTGFYNNGGTINSISGGTFTPNEGTEVLMLMSYGGTIGEITGNARFTGALKATSNAALLSNSGGTIGTISGGTFETTHTNASAIAAIRTTGQINSITGGTINAAGGYGIYASGSAKIGDISGINITVGNACSSSNYAVYLDVTASGGIASISSGSFTSRGTKTNNASMYVRRGTIGTISGGTFTGAKDGITLNGLSTVPGTIGTISGGTFTSGTTSGSLKLGNYATVSSITGGKFTSTYAGIYLTNANAKIESITGGSISGNSYGIYLSNGTIEHINGGTIGSSTSSYGINVNTNGKLNDLSGNVVVEGKTNAILVSGTLVLENDVVSANAAMGNVRYKTSSNSPSSQVSNASAIPAGYHMSKTLDDGYHFLVKDNTVIYDGNGSTTADGKTKTAIAGESASVTVASNTDAGFDVPAGYTSFSNWNTAADGSGTAYAAGDTATVPSGGELVLYAQWGVDQPTNVTVKHSFNYLVDSSVTSQFTWRSDPTVSEVFQADGPVSPKTLFESTTAINHNAWGISTKGGAALAVDGEMDVDLRVQTAGVTYPLTYKLTGVKVNGEAVTDLTTEIGFDEDATVEFTYELVPIDIVIDYDADLEGQYKGAAHIVNKSDTQNLSLTGSDNATYLVEPTQVVDLGGSQFDQPWGVQGSRIVVGTTTIMPTNPLARYSTSNLDSSTWTQNADGTYAVPGQNVNVDYTGSAFHGVSYSDKRLPDELFNVSYKPVTITVTKAPLTITVTDQTHIANGGPQGEDNASYTNNKNETPNTITAKVSVEGLQGNDYVRSIKLNGSETEVGTYAGKIVASDAVIGFVNGDNEYARTGCYEITYVAGKLTIESNETTYTVKHLQQNVNDDNYTEVTADTQTVDAAIGDEVTPAVKTYDGFTSPGTQTVTVARDNATVVEYKYDRKQITVSFDANGHGSNPADKTGKFGAALGELPAAPSDEAVFEGWFTEATDGTKISAATTFPAENVTYYAHWKEYVYEDVQTGERFTTLQDAFNAANDGDTIRPLKDHTERTNATVPAGKNVTLDTSEHKLTVNGFIGVNGGLTIGDGLTVKGSGTTMTVNSGGTLTMKGGDLLSSGGNGLTVASGGTVTEITCGTIEGTQAAINVAGTIGEIKAGTIHTTETSNAQALWVQPGGRVEKISGGEFKAEGNANAVTVFAQNSTPAVIGEISGGTFSGGDHGVFTTGKGHVNTISGGTFTGQSGLWMTGGVSGETYAITGGTFDGGATGYGAMIGTYGNGSWDITGGTFKGSTGLGSLGLINVLKGVTVEATSIGIENHKTITLISEGTEVKAGLDAICNQGTIATIESGTFDGGRYGLNNGVKAETISGGTFTGNVVGVLNAATIDKITGGEVTGPTGIQNTADGTITSIDVANEGDLVVTGSDGPALLNDGGTVSAVKGSGVYIGKDNALKSTSGTVKLEPGLDGLVGNGRFQTTSNTPASELDGDSIILPDGYHVIKSTTTGVTDESGQFRFLIKDNTVLYDGGGHDVADDSKNEPNGALNGLVPVAYEGQPQASDNGADSDVHFTENGQHFAGWSGDGATYQPGDTVEFDEEAFSDMILKAAWKDIHKVTFDTDGGSPEPEDQQVVDGEKATEPTAPTKTGHTFAGWFDEAGNRYDFSKPVTGPVTLKARWTLNSYPVTFDSNGGSAVPSQTVDHGSRASQPANPTRAGYTFAGWVDASGNPYSFSTPVTGPLALTARWTANPAPAPAPVTPAPDPTPAPAPAPVTPAATPAAQPVPEPEQVPDEPTPIAPTPEPEVVPDEPAPLTPEPELGAWALLNLIAALVTCVLSAFRLGGIRRDQDDEDENDDEQRTNEERDDERRRKNRKGLRLATLVPAIGSVIAFILTEDMNLPMVLIDRWTLLMAVILLAQGVLAYLARDKKEDGDDDQDPAPQAA